MNHSVLGCFQWIRVDANILETMPRKTEEKRLSSSVRTRVSVFKQTLLLASWQRPVLRSIHWLPVCHMINFLLLVYEALSGFGPKYISDLLLRHEPSTPPRSSAFCPERYDAPTKLQVQLSLLLNQDLFVSDSLLLKQCHQYLKQHLYFSLFFSIFNLFKCVLIHFYASVKHFELTCIWILRYR